MKLRDLPRELCSRTQSFTTLAYPRRVNSGCTFLARCIAAFWSAPSTITCRQGPRGECPLLLRCDSRAKHLIKTLKPFARLTATAFSGCLDRYDSASVFLG